jgi:hypothetical protein
MRVLNNGPATKHANTMKRRHRTRSCKISVSLRLLARDTGVSAKKEMLPIFSVFPLRTFHKWINTGMMIPAIAQSHMDDAKLIKSIFLVYSDVLKNL